MFRCLYPCTAFNRGTQLPASIRSRRNGARDHAIDIGKNGGVGRGPPLNTDRARSVRQDPRDNRPGDQSRLKWARLMRGCKFGDRSRCASGLSRNGALAANAGEALQHSPARTIAPKPSHPAAGGHNLSRIRTEFSLARLILAAFHQNASQLKPQISTASPRTPSERSASRADLAEAAI